MSQMKFTYKIQPQTPSIQLLHFIGDRPAHGTLGAVAGPTTAPGSSWVMRFWDRKQ